ncbi:MAG: nucleotidyltransferase domain-containing protein [Melioribacteraceae bacterium]|nr:nucleotidyltransferase domain-containing protein [Melioribacteraceae bacterium]
MNTKNIHIAIQEFKQLVQNQYSTAEITLFGSVAKNTFNNESDIDLLVLLPVEVNNTIEMELFSLAYDIELKYEVVLGVIVYSKQFWGTKKAAAMALYKNIELEGMVV